MLIDCETCQAPADACGDCVMTVLLQIDPRPVDLDDAERDAIGRLAGVGLVPPLRLVVGVPSGFGADEPAPDYSVPDVPPDSVADESGEGVPDDAAGMAGAELSTDDVDCPIYDDTPGNRGVDPVSPPRLRGIA